MTLGAHQRAFMHDVGRLLMWIYEQGLSVSGGDLFRDARVHGEYGKKESYSHPYSNHKLKLAIDLNLFDEDGRYQSSTEAHRKIGEYWESLSPFNRWGGRFKDGNHYERLQKEWK